MLLVSTNGIGIGHFARTLAIARRLGPEADAVLVTLSAAARLGADCGFVTEHIPFHGYLRCENAAWNRKLAAELQEMLSFYRPAVVLFDGMMPYRGLIEALGSYSEGWSVWCRQSLWRAEAEETGLRRANAFDLVIEPGELAAAADRGPTTRVRHQTRGLPPFRLLDRAEMLSREDARAALRLEPNVPAALILPGSGSNFDAHGMIVAAVAALQQRGIQLVALEWPISERELDLPPVVRRLRRFPLSRYLNAFDLAISVVGYNTFHELLLAAVPTIFVPNEHPIMDDQLARALWAEREGHALCVRHADLGRLTERVGDLLDRGGAEACAAACRTLPHRNGALDAARLLQRLAGAAALAPARAAD